MAAACVTVHGKLNKTQLSKILPFAVIALVSGHP